MKLDYNFFDFQTNYLSPSEKFSDGDFSYGDGLIGITILAKNIRIFEYSSRTVPKQSLIGKERIRYPCEDVHYVQVIKVERKSLVRKLLVLVSKYQMLCFNVKYGWIQG